jgi:hypothetical protein
MFDVLPLRGCFIKEVFKMQVAPAFIQVKPFQALSLKIRFALPVSV